MHIKDFADRHLNKLCFVTGASPSLRFVDPAVLQRYVTICVNSSILKFPNCNYFVTDDQGVTSWNYWYKTVHESNCINFLFRDKLKNHVHSLSENRVVFYDHRHWIKEPKEHADIVKTLHMFKDPDVPIIGARSSIASALNIAYIMGCNPIVLLGIDGCFENNKRYYWQFDGEPRAYELHNRFSNVANRGLLYNKPVDQHCVDYDIYWRHFATANPELLNGAIINSSVNGILSIFPKVEINTVMSMYGDRYD